MGKKAKRVYSIQSSYMEQYEQKQRREYRRKKSLMKRLAVTGVAMLLIVIFVANYHIGQRTVYSEKMAQYEALQAEHKELKKEERELLEEIQLLEDDAYILDIARTNYFLSREGELIFQLEDFDSSY